MKESLEKWIAMIRSNTFDELGVDMIVAARKNRIISKSDFKAIKRAAPQKQKKLLISKNGYAGNQSII